MDRRDAIELARLQAADGRRSFGFQRATSADAPEWNLPLYREFFLYATARDVEHPTDDEVANRALFFLRLAPGKRHIHRSRAAEQLRRLQVAITDALKPPRPPKPPKAPKPSKRRMKGETEPRPRPKPYDPEGMKILLFSTNINFLLHFIGRFLRSDVQPGLSVGPSEGGGLPTIYPLVHVSAWGLEPDSESDSESESEPRINSPSPPPYSPISTRSSPEPIDQAMLKRRRCKLVFDPILM